MLLIKDLSSINEFTDKYDIMLDDIKIGFIDLNKVDDYVEIVYLNIYEEFRGRGYGKKVLLLLNEQYNLIGDSEAVSVGFFHKVGATFENNDYLTDDLKEASELGILYPIKVPRGQLLKKLSII